MADWFDISTGLITPRRGNFTKTMFSMMAKAIEAVTPISMPNIIPNNSFEWVDTALSRPYCWTITTNNTGECSMSTGHGGNYSLRFTKGTGTASGGFALMDDYLPLSGYATGNLSGYVYGHTRINSTASHVDCRISVRYYDTAYTLVSSRTIASHVVAGGFTTDLLLGDLGVTAVTSNVHWAKIKLAVGATGEAINGWGEFDRIFIVPPAI